MGNSFYFEFERIFMEFLQSFLNPFTEALAVFFTFFGEETILIIVMGYLYWCYDKELGKKIATNIALGLVLGPMIKNVLCRRRPYMDIETLKCVKAPNADRDIYDIAAQGFSCPSGHSMNSVTVFGSLAYYKNKNRILKVLAFVIPLLVGLSRVTLGVHYPTDVALGWACGIVIVFGIPFLQSKLQKRWILHLIIFIIAALGCFYCRTEDYFTGLGFMAGLFLAMPFEEKFVKFKNTNNIFESVLRIIVGIACYLLLNPLLKLFLISNIEIVALILRSVRYCIIIIVLLGIYPMLFKLIPKKIFKKQ